MKKHLEQLKRSLCVLLTIVAGALWTACDEAIVIGAADEQSLETALEQQGFLRDVSTARTAIPVEVRADTEVKVYLGLTQAAEAPTSARVAVDASLVEAYNKANNADYPAFPAAQVAIANSGNLSVAKWHKASEPLTITLSKGALEEQTYLLPLTISNEGVNVPEAEKTLYYFVKVAGAVPDITKGSVKTLVYIEVNNTNPLNAGNYVLQDSRKPFFDYVVIFAANVQYNRATNEVYLKYNENVEHLLNNRDKYIKPLQDKGIKVLLGLLPDHAGVGIANLHGTALRDFAAKCKAAIDNYKLDGLDYDDEWAEYGSVNTDIFTLPEWAASGTKMARLIIETRRIMPDKIITVFEYNNGRSVGGTVDGVNMTSIIDYSMYPSYANGAYTTRSSSIGMPKEKYSPTAVNLGPAATIMSDSNVASWANGIKTNGYGFMFFYDLRDYTDYTTKFSGASNALYGEPVVMERDAYPKDW
ncbi:MAG: DUF1735 domain-containing protein [Prevotellaceae bacterium]|nr:DUF1735 domain-containing protein [Prevotellaceae bacterium]